MATDSRDRVRSHRQRLRARGLRPIQVWVPDVTSSAFARQAHVQSLAVATSASEREEQAFVDELTDWDEE